MVNTTWATEMLRDDHARIQDLFDDFVDPAEKDRRADIADQLIGEIRIHRALVEEVLLPAVREAAKDPAALSDMEEELAAWEPLLNAVERVRVTDVGIASAWNALQKEMKTHLEKGHQGLVELTTTLPLNFVDMGLRMEELRRQIVAERPISRAD
jgi:hypothetical protein